MLYGYLHFFSDPYSFAWIILPMSFLSIALLSLNQRPRRRINVGQARRLLRRSTTLISRALTLIQPDPGDDRPQRRPKSIVRSIITSLIRFHLQVITTHPGLQPKPHWLHIEFLSKLLQQFLVYGTLSWSSCLFIGWLMGFPFGSSTIFLATGALWCLFELFGKDADN